MKTAYAYSRFSSDNQREESIDEAQKETLRKLVYKITVFDDNIHLSTTIRGEEVYDL